MERMTEDTGKGASYLVYEIERRAYPLTDEPFMIGRDASSGILIREPAVSRTHAEVRRDGGEFVLSSTGATGTKLNGAPVTAPQKLTDGDRIEIGSAEISFRQGRLPLGVSVIDPVTGPGHDADAMTRRSTIQNPILAKDETRVKRKSPVGTIVLFVILMAVATWYFLTK
jgi:pSer/pThr/pTyr-binding forkhead associated (FHA) protein